SDQLVITPSAYHIAQQINSQLTFERRYSTPRTRDLQEIIQQHLAIFRLHASSPPHHFVDFAIPLLAGESLLTDDIIIVTNEASFAKQLPLACFADRRHRRRAVGNRKLRITRSHVDASCDIPKIPAWIPLLH